MTSETFYRTASIEGVDIFYREAGPLEAPTVVLLHGFPSSSRMYRDLIPILADRYHVIAPDYPAFGHSGVPPREQFHYTHQHLAEVMDGLLTKLGIGRFVLYMMDFGGPIGFKLMLKYPDRLIGGILQNAPAFGEVFDGDFWQPLVTYWKSDTPENRNKARKVLTPEDVKYQYVAGASDPELIDPDSWTIDSALIARPGVDEIMLDLLHDIHSNGPTVAAAKKFICEHQKLFMIATGCNDPLFPGPSMKPPADMPDVEFHAIDGGHFALEEKSAEIGRLALDFLDSVTAS